MIEERLERRQFLLCLFLPLEEKRERGSVQHGFFYIERRVLPQRQGDGVARPSVQSDEPPSLRKNQVREEHLSLRSVNHHGVDTCIQVGERVQHEIVGHGPREFHVLQRHADLCRLGGPNPNGHNARLPRWCLLYGLQNQHGRLVLPCHHQCQHFQRNHALSFTLVR